jgi:hypothetical protein
MLPEQTLTVEPESLQRSDRRGVPRIGVGVHPVQPERPEREAEDGRQSRGHVPSPLVLPAEGESKLGATVDRVEGSQGASADDLVAGLDSPLEQRAGLELIANVGQQGGGRSQVREGGEPPIACNLRVAENGEQFRYVGVG